MTAEPTIAHSMKSLFCLCLLIATLSLVSCNSSRRLARSNSERAQLSEHLGFPVGHKDNIPLCREAASWLGTPYRYGGNTRKGVDCSGLVCQVYRKVYNTTLQRNSAAMAEKDCKRISAGKLRPGDLVFFSTSKRRKGINHVGIVLKDRYFIHTSSSKGVIVSNLNENYYRKTWKKGGRVRK